MCVCVCVCVHNPIQHSRTDSQLCVFGCDIPLEMAQVIKTCNTCSFLGFGGGGGGAHNCLGLNIGSTAHSMIIVSSRRGRGTQATGQILH